MSSHQHRLSFHHLLFALTFSSPLITAACGSTADSGAGANGAAGAGQTGSGGGGQDASASSGDGGAGPITSGTTASTSSTSSGSDPPPCGGLGSGTSTCEQCAGQACCAEGAACASSAECVALSACVDGCTTQSCANDCAERHPEGIDSYVAMIECVQSSCRSECGTSPTKGTGDSCDSDAECESGDCADGAWCSRRCSDDADCPGSQPGFLNEHGGTNVCYRPAGFCYPACSGQADCDVYGLDDTGARVLCRSRDDVIFCATDSAGTPVR